MTITAEQKREIINMLDYDEDEDTDDSINYEYTEKYTEMLEIWEYYNNVWADDVKEQWFVEKMKAILSNTYN